MLCWLPLASQPRVIFGRYGSARSGRDAIRIIPKSNGKIGFILHLYYANGHTCQLEKEGEWRDDHIVILAEGLKENEPCRLQAFFSKGRITLKEEGRRCAEVYCGTRGKLDGVTLNKR